MSLNFGTTDKEALVTLMNVVNGMHEDLYNGGKDGFFTRDTKWKAAHDATEQERDRQHKANITRLNILIGLAMMILTALLVIASLVGPILRTKAKPPLLSDHPEPEVSQDAGNPPF
jgi:hypothetical protein